MLQIIFYRCGLVHHYYGATGLMKLINFFFFLLANYLFGSECVSFKFCYTTFFNNLNIVSNQTVLWSINWKKKFSIQTEQWVLGPEFSFGFLIRNKLDIPRSPFFFVLIPSVFRVEYIGWKSTGIIRSVISIFLKTPK